MSTNGRDDGVLGDFDQTKAFEDDLRLPGAGA
jgi:hypothetical protein